MIVDILQVSVPDSYGANRQLLKIPRNPIASLFKASMPQHLKR